MSKLGQVGDTIVEVLIAITVVSAMLGGAYVTANRSTKNNRQAQERGEALKLAEGQLERLKTALNVNNQAIVGTTGEFCVDANNAPQNAAQGSNCQSTAGITYRTVITRPVTNLFRVTTTWDSLTRGTTDQVSMLYRLYESGTSQTVFSDGIPAIVEPAPPPPQASGTLRCDPLSSGSIRLTYSHANASTVNLFRGSTRLTSVSAASGTYDDTGLNASTPYTYYLRNGASDQSQSLGTATCSTQAPPAPVSGTLSCEPTISGIIVNYSHSNASGPSIWRDGTYVYNAGASSGTFTDTGTAFNQPYTYYLRNGQSGGSPVLASVNCEIQFTGIDLSNINLPLCFTTGC